MRISVSLCLFLLTFLYACTSNEKVEQEATESAQPGTAGDEVPFTGFWISESYFNSIRETSSPRESQEKAECIYIPERTQMPAMLISQFHEGGPVLTIVKDKDQYQVWEMKDSVTRGQLLAPVQVVSDQKLKVANKVFVKLNLHPVPDDYLVLEEILFKGTYSDSEKNVVVFKNDGSITGLGDYTYYSPVLDYYDAGMQVDQVGFGTSKDDDLDYFGFKFTGTQLEIYELNCLQYDTDLESCGEVEFGKLVHTLYKN